MKNGDNVRMAGVRKLVSAGLLKRPAGTHLDADLLAAFAENVLLPAERERALEHLSFCQDCREILFLAQPDVAERMVIVPVKKNAAPMFRWTALAASVAIVASGVYLARHEVERRAEVGVQKVPTAGYVAMTDEKVAPQLPKREVANPAAGPKEVSARPALKHMTAEPKAKMQFDSTDQVRVTNAVVPAAPQNLPTRSRDEMALRDLVATAPTPARQETNKAQPWEAPRSTNETVTVTGEAPVVETQAAAQVSKEAYSAQKSEAFGNSAGAVVGGMVAPVAQWSLSRKGELQRSFDQGNNWQRVTVNGPRGVFHAVSSSGQQVWVGGKNGALYHSADSGLTWTSVTPTAGGKQLAGDIDHIEFTDPQHGTVSAAGAVWTTTDGGQTWLVSSK